MANPALALGAGPEMWERVLRIRRGGGDQSEAVKRWGGG